MTNWRPVFAAGMVLAAAGFARQQGASVSSAVDRVGMTLGDRVTLTVTVTHDSSETVSWAPPPDTLGPFEVVEVVTGDAVPLDGRLRSGARYVLTAFELGELEIPSIEVGVTGPDGASQVLRTAPVTVTLGSVGRDDDGDIRAIKPPLAIARNWLLLLPWLVAVAVLAALGYWAHSRYRRRSRPEHGEASRRAPSRPAHEIAYEALARLEESDLIRRGKIKKFFIEVSEIIRTYLDGRYGIDAMDMASPDVMGELEHASLTRQQLDLFATFLERSDLVKFAKHRPLEAACVEMIPIARRLIDETLPLLPPTDGSDSTEAPARELAGGRRRVPVSG